MIYIYKCKKKNTRHEKLKFSKELAALISPDDNFKFAWQPETIDVNLTMTTFHPKRV